MTKAKLKPNGITPVAGDIVQLGNGHATWRVESIDDDGYRARLYNLTNFRHRYGVHLRRLIVTHRNGSAV